MATAMLSSASIRYSVSRFLIRFLMGVALNGCRDFQRSTTQALIHCGNLGRDPLWFVPCTIGNFYSGGPALQLRLAACVVISLRTQTPLRRQTVAALERC